MKKIIFNAMILDNKPTGLGVYTKNILERIGSKESITKIICKNKELIKKQIPAIDEEKLIEISYGDSKIKSFYRNLFTNNYVNKNFNDKGFLIYSSTQHGVNNSRVKQIVTVHDVIALFNHKGRYIQYLYYKFIFPIVLKKVDLIITISNSTKNDLIKFYKIMPEKIKVIYNGFDKPQKIDKKYSLNYMKDKYSLENYILMVGINYEYKNLHTVIEIYSKIFDEVKSPLVIVGNCNNRYGKYLIELVHSLNLESHIKFLGYVTEEERQYIYQAASMFVYPTLYEGFGLPPLESMANGTPVICSNTSSLPEVVGNAAILFNPNDKQDIEKCIKKMHYMEEKEKLEYIERGYENIKKFSWDKTARDILSVLENIN